MPKPSLRILQVSLQDIYGGAEKVAWNLFQSARERGFPAWLAVHRKSSNDPDVLVIPKREDLRGPWFQFWWAVHARCMARPGRIARQFGRMARWLTEPVRLLENRLGIED